MAATIEKNSQSISVPLSHYQGIAFQVFEIFQ